MRPVIAAQGQIEQVIPGSFATWHSEDTSNTQSISGDRILAIIGKASGGAPLKPYLVTNNDANLTKLLQSGELLQAARFALSQGVGSVVLVNPAPGTPATLQIKGDGNTVFGKATTVAYRETANQTRMAIVGSTQDGFTLSLTNGLTGTSITANRIGLGLFLAYAGAGVASASVTLDASGQKTLDITVAGAPQDNVKIALSGLTIADLIRRLQDSGPYNALFARDATLAAAGLDITAQPLNIGAYAVLGTVTAAESGATALTVTALSRAIAKGEVLRVYGANGWMPVTVAADAAKSATALTVAPLSAAIAGGSNLFDARALPLKSLSAVKADFQLFFDTKLASVATFEAGAADAPVAQSGYFAGAASLEPSAEDWGEAMSAAIEAFPFGTAVALQSDRSISFGLRSATQARRHPRASSPIQFVEALPEYMLPSGETPEDLQAYLTVVATEIASVNDRDSIVVGQSVVGGLTPTGVTGRENTYMAALRVATARASYGPGISLTNKVIGGTNPFPRLGDSTDAFVRAGLMALGSDRRNTPTKAILGRTAYVGEDNLAYESEKTVAIMNALTRDFRAIGADTVPGAGNTTALADYKRRLDARCDKAVSDGWLVAGLDERGQQVAPYENQVFNTSYQGRLVSAASKLNPAPEFLMTDHDIVSRMVEIEVSA